MIINADRTLEFVCTGNVCRSVLAELFAKKHVRDNDLKGINVVSSGTRVDELKRIFAREIPFPYQEELGMVKNALQRGSVYGQVDRAKLDGLLRMENLPESEQEYFHEKAHEASETYCAEDIRFRDAIITEFGLDYPVNRTSIQSVVRPDTVLVLGMSIRNIEPLRQAYHRAHCGRNHVPILDTLRGHAEATPDAEFIYPFGTGDLGKYFVMAREIKEYVEKSIDKMMAMQR